MYTCQVYIRSMHFSGCKLQQTMTYCARLMYEAMQPQSQQRTFQRSITPLNSLSHQLAVQRCSLSACLLHSQAAAMQITQTTQAGSNTPLQQAIIQSCQTCRDCKQDGPPPCLIRDRQWQCPCRMQVARLAASTVALWPLCIHAEVLGLLRCCTTKDLTLQNIRQ